MHLSKKFGYTYKEIEEAILDGKIENTHEAAKQYLMTLQEKYSNTLN